MNTTIESEIKEQMDKVKEIKRMRERAFNDKVEALVNNEFERAETLNKLYEHQTLILINEQEKLIMLMNGYIFYSKPL